jgi:hypothetical protein
VLLPLLSLSVLLLVLLGLLPRKLSCTDTWLEGEAAALPLLPLPPPLLLGLLALRGPTDTVPANCSEHLQQLTYRRCSSVSTILSV